MPKHRRIKVVGRDLDAERAERTAEAAEFLKRWNNAAEAVLADTTVWAEEARREAAPPLPWPLQVPAKGWDQVRVLLAEAKVLEVYAQLAAGRCGHMLLPPMDAAARDIQILLRVAARAAAAGQAALVQHYGGRGRMSLKREFAKMAAEIRAEEAREAARLTGGSVRAAFAAAGMAPQTAYNAEARAKARRR